jgi:tetratricopeptide (TPR) repeat protein
MDAVPEPLPAADGPAEPEEASAAPPEPSPARLVMPSAPSPIPHRRHSLAPVAGDPAEPPPDTLAAGFARGIARDVAPPIPSHEVATAFTGPVLPRDEGDGDPGLVHGPPPPRLVMPWPAPPSYEALDLLQRTAQTVVYKARDLRSNRLVVLHLMLPSAGTDLEERIRCRLEAEAVGRLRHPHIVPVLEVGEHEDCLYLVLEHIEGQTLAQALAGGQWAIGSQDNQRRAARLIATLARALSCAHQQGAVHRDLQPVHVLLQKKADAPDDEAEPRLTGFAFTRSLASGGAQARARSASGTAAYLAPEQTTGRPFQVGPAADVYGLGAILFEMLTGRQFAQDAAPLDQHRPRIVRDLACICRQCLEKEPGCRYASALALAEDLERFLAGESVLARPTAAWRRAWKRARRRALVALLAACVLLPLGFFAGGLWQGEKEGDSNQQPRGTTPLAVVPMPPDRGAEQTRRLAEQKALADQQARDALARQLLAEKQEQKARAQLALVEKERRQAQEKLARAEKQREDTLAQHELIEKSRRNALAERDQALKNSEETQARFRAACDVLDRLLASLTEAELAQHPEHRTVLEKSLHFFEGYLKEAAQQEQRAASWARIGDIHRLLGQAEKAATAYQQALRLWSGPALAEQPGARQRLALVQFQLAVLAAARGDQKTAEGADRQAIATLEALPEAEANALPVQLLRARSYTKLGATLRRAGEHDQAGQMLGKARALWLGILQDHPQVAAAREGLASTWNETGLLERLPDPPAAETAFRKAADILQSLVVLQPLNADYRSQLGLALHSLAVLLADRSQVQEARRLLEEAIAQERAALKDNPNHRVCRRHLRDHFSCLASVLERLGDPAGAGAAAVQLAEVFPQHWPDALEAACCLGRGITRMEKDYRLADGPRRAAVLKNGDAAVRLLRQALRCGMQADKLAQEPDLAPLRARADFQRLVQEARSVGPTTPINGPLLPER